MNRERFAWGASLGAIVGYTLAVLTSYPIRIIYFPHSDSWGLVDVPGQPAIAWYGRLINAGMGAMLGMGILWPIRRPMRWPVIGMAAIVALLVLAFHERHWFGR
jgi:hypothetical protein